MCLLLALLEAGTVLSRRADCQDKQQTRGGAPVRPGPRCPDPVPQEQNSRAWLHLHLHRGPSAGDKGLMLWTHGRPACSLC